VFAPTSVTYDPIIRPHLQSERLLTRQILCVHHELERVDLGRYNCGFNPRPACPIFRRKFTSWSIARGIASSPATTTGIVHSLWKKHFGPEGDPLCLVVQSDSLGLNPTLRKSVIDRAFEENAESAAAEFGGMFKEPLSAFLSREIIERAVERGVSERQPLPGLAYQWRQRVRGERGQRS
jgi:hypothetical protein